MTADEWNAAHPVGTPVVAHPASRDAAPLYTRTRTPAWTLGHGAAVVAVEGRTGGIALDHVDVATVHDAATELLEATGIIQHLTGREYVGDPATTQSRIATAKARADRARAVLVRLGQADDQHQAVQRHDFEVGPEWTGAAA